jgi:hypothetical protein
VVPRWRGQGRGCGLGVRIGVTMGVFSGELSALHHGEVFSSEVLFAAC